MLKTGTSAHAYIYNTLQSDAYIHTYIHRLVWTRSNPSKYCYDFSSFCFCFCASYSPSLLSEPNSKLSHRPLLTPSDDVMSNVPRVRFAKRRLRNIFNRFRRRKTVRKPEHVGLMHIKDISRRHKASCDVTWRVCPRGETGGPFRSRDLNIWNVRRLENKLQNSANGLLRINWANLSFDISAENPERNPEPTDKTSSSSSSGNSSRKRSYFKPINQKPDLSAGNRARRGVQEADWFGPSLIPSPSARGQGIAEKAHLLLFPIRTAHWPVPVGYRIN